MEFEKEFELAKTVIKGAGEILLSYYHKSGNFAQKEDGSFLTEADIASEEFIKRKFADQFPEYGFIGEETEGIEKEISWIIDPLDGTLAFTRHLAEFGIAVALKKGNKLIFGVEYIPLSSDLLFAFEGQGAYKNDSRLSVSVTDNMSKAFATIGMQNFWKESYIDRTASLLRQKINNHFHVGLSSVVEAYYLASGIVDLYIRFEQPIWDIAAQYVLMKEAGAVITDEYGKPLQISFSKDARHNLVVTNPLLAEQARDLLCMKG